MSSSPADYTAILIGLRKSEEHKRDAKKAREEADALRKVVEQLQDEKRQLQAAIQEKAAQMQQAEDKARGIQRNLAEMNAKKDAEIRRLSQLLSQK